MADIHLKPIARFKIFGSICKIEPATTQPETRLIKMKIPNIELNPANPRNPL